MENPKILRLSFASVILSQQFIARLIITKVFEQLLIAGICCAVTEPFAILINQIVTDLGANNSKIERPCAEKLERLPDKTGCLQNVLNSSSKKSYASMKNRALKFLDVIILVVPTDGIIAF